MYIVSIIQYCSRSYLFWQYNHPIIILKNLVVNDSFISYY